MSGGSEQYARALRGRRRVDGAETVAREPRAPRLLLPWCFRALPIAVAIAFGAQLWAKGLEPAWREHVRLAVAHANVSADHAELVALHTELATAREALEDPLYQERRRRWRYERGTARALAGRELDEPPADRRALADAIARHGGLVVAAWRTVPEVEGNAAAAPMPDAPPALEEPPAAAPPRPPAAPVPETAPRAARPAPPPLSQPRPSKVR